MPPLVGLRVVAVHAHPDDEAIWTGGLLADLAARGATVTVVTCTLGEEGETIGPALEHLVQAEADQLGGYRMAELAAAIRTLSVEHRYLGGAGRFRDSGMVGSPAHADMRAFVNNGVAALDALNELLAELQPDLIVTYGPDGGYGHPDHIQAHNLVAAASFTPQRTLWAVTDTDTIVDGCRQITSWPKTWVNTPEEIASTREWDCAYPLSPAACDAKVQAMRAHATQVWVADGRPHPLGAGVARARTTAATDSALGEPPVVWALSNLVVQPAYPVEHYAVGAGLPLPQGAVDVAAGLVAGGQVVPTVTAAETSAAAVSAASAAPGGEGR
ncbi:N-acetyl-1-D-myo-inositol-2-amino-2-deoxy-alpha-D-glucopyranoside deacetylase [Corynebacterium sp. 13CS0277]|uniref:N-acetyl-1-D-myo-inositol-2-amino-2-deoxy-alpha- D-glucopyranoside deacetylase n=1 Tax=Corynebacterium sp. 13CS0277 TaxID=2071994 RepID=UPI001E4F2567|nr:N-acetyl-1-D-myo-inositol-2-amino-2-deoxy-alpha-D-glucopyranoside deacetylase [Corynebacterium sp. 13CS0277]